ncbi:MAG: hypothetical protein OEV21_06365 [Thermoplasmata archaeon]|nr:hypothetical protein [Thermoplasmata archaeon]
MRIRTSILREKDGHEEEQDRISDLDMIRAIALFNVSLRVGLPVQKALMLAYRTSKGRLNSAFGRVLRKAATGQCEDLDRAISDTCKELPKRLDWAVRAVDDHLVSLSESDEAIRDNLLEYSFISALDSCRQSIREAISGLRVPVSTIFALGMILPIVLATILPLWGFVSYDLGMESMYAFGSPDSGIFLGRTWAQSLSSIAILMFPIICLIVSRHFLSSKEFLTKEGDRIDALLVAMGCIIFLSLVFLAINDSDFSLIVFMAMALLLIALSEKFSKKEYNAGDNGMVAYDPATLDRISARIELGEHYARAMACSDKETNHSSRMFWRAVLPVSSIAPCISEFENATEQLIVESSTQDPKLSARTLRQLARHMNELRRIELEARLELKPIIQSIAIATVILSPFVLGIVSGFDTAQAILNPDSGSGPGFQILFAAFIVEMTLLGSWFVRGLTTSNDKISKIVKRADASAAIALAIFCLSLALSSAMFG